MADRQLAGAAACFVAALVLAGMALVLLGLREPTPPATARVSVPAPPPAATTQALPSSEDVARDAEPSSAQPPAATVPARRDEAGAGGDAATAADPAVTASAPPSRLVVIATGIAWNDELAAAAAFRLPSAVAFALPADLPTAVERLSRWAAAGRRVVVRFDWRPSTAAGGGVVPLEAERAVQAARMEEQLARLGEAAAGVVVEPHAALTLAPAVRSLAAVADRPILMGATTPAPPPFAWRLDAALSGEAGFEEALASVLDGTEAGETLVLLVEIYPALLDRFVLWLRELEATGIALVPVDAVGEDER